MGILFCLLAFYWVFCYLFMLGYYTRCRMKFRWYNVFAVYLLMFCVSGIMFPYWLGNNFKFDRY